MKFTHWVRKGAHRALCKRVVEGSAPTLPVVICPDCEAAYRRLPKYALVECGWQPVMAPPMPWAIAA